MSPRVESEPFAGPLRDRVVNRVFGSELTVSCISNPPQVDPEVTERLDAVIAEIDAAVIDIRSAALDDAIGNRLTRRPTWRGRVPARPERRLQVVPAQPVAPLARRVGNVFYGIAPNLPLHYESGQAEPRTVTLDDGA